MKIHDKLQRKFRRWVISLHEDALHEAARTETAETLVVFSSNGSGPYARFYLQLAYSLWHRFKWQSFDLYREKPAAPKILTGFEVSGCMNKPQVVVDHLPSVGWVTARDSRWAGSRDLNYFNYLENSIQTRQKRYQLDWNDDVTAQQFFEAEVQAHAIVKLLNTLDKWAKTNQKQVLFVGREPEYVPDGIAREYCMNRHGTALRYVDCGRGYYHYFGGSTGQPMYLCSLTSKSEKRSRMQLCGSDLVKIGTAEREKVLEAILNRATQDDDESPIISEIRKTNEAGGKVAVLFAHMFYDKPADDSAPAFTSMLDWIDESIRIFGQRPQDLLILKPHINEDWIEEPHRNPNETLATYVAERGPLPRNVRLLNPREFSLAKLINHFDVGLVWRSSVGLELLATGCRVIIAGRAPYSALVPSPQPRSREEYKEMIDELQPNTDSRERALDYIASLEKAHVRVSSEPGRMLMTRMFGSPSLADWFQSHAGATAKSDA